MTNTHTTNLSVPETLQNAMDIAYVKARKGINAPRKSWSSIRSEHV